jgi:type II secretory pathway component PulF
MRAAWKVFCLSAIILAAAIGLAHLLVPDVVPVGYAEEPQASWAILTAFALRAIALTAAWIAIITLSVLVGAKFYQIVFRADRARNDRAVTR